MQNNVKTKKWLCVLSQATFTAHSNCILWFCVCCTVIIPITNDGLCFLEVLWNIPPRTFWIRAILPLRQFWQPDRSHTHSQLQTHSLTPSLPDMGFSQMVLFTGAGLALLQTMGVAGLAPQITDGLIEAVRQHGQLATVTQGARSAAWTATMLAAVGLLETGETH